MLKTRTILGCMLVFMMVMAPMMSVGAAAPAQTTTIDGTVQSCELATDNFTGDPIVVCVINLTGGGTKVIRLSVDDAVANDLASVGEDGTVTIIATEGQDVSIDDSLLLIDPCVMPEDASQPISKALTGFFCEDLGTSYEDLQALHKDGFGFGEIAQACFMAIKLDGTGELCADILYAKKSGDYSKLSLPDDVTVSNWGQLRKAVLDHEKKSNLGSVVSDKEKNTNNGNSDKDNGKGKTAEHGKAKK